ncbi:Ubiquitously transcribed sex (X/Y) chromosome tetratricopeptide repeat protein [Fasciola gigantica]|uniref:Ubiquitously transcribed sex (X/Y) chromosome tetratricopeptide repeat protein n=1 Tax=Fasciola gigantica TaxID=46835 RepID=A0A504Z8E8_FASGI|nr:Ubiquitously transcribed sex (X/Y) chromosome tetratricopeptide repeat protein [Fasciola gigantica]
MDPSLHAFTILAEYYIHELSTVYDEFQLQTQPITAYPVGKA